MENIQNNNSVVIPDAEHDYHGHPNYGKILRNLMILFALSLVVGYLFSPMIAVSLIFGAAIWKTSLVVNNFMHLKYEPVLIWVLIAAVLFILFAFFFGIYPDICAVRHEVTPR